MVLNSIHHDTAEEKRRFIEHPEKNSDEYVFAFWLIEHGKTQVVLTDQSLLYGWTTFESMSCAKKVCMWKKASVNSQLPFLRNISFLEFEHGKAQSILEVLNIWHAGWHLQHHQEKKNHD